MSLTEAKQSHGFLRGILDTHAAATAPSDLYTLAIGVIGINFPGLWEDFSRLGFAKKHWNENVLGGFKEAQDIWNAADKTPLGILEAIYESIGAVLQGLSNFLECYPYITQTIKRVILLSIMLAIYVFVPYSSFILGGLGIVGLFDSITEIKKAKDRQDYSNSSIYNESLQKEAGWIKKYRIKKLFKSLLKKADLEEDCKKALGILDDVTSQEDKNRLADLKKLLAKIERVLDVSTYKEHDRRKNAHMTRVEAKNARVPAGELIKFFNEEQLQCIFTGLTKDGDVSGKIQIKQVREFIDLAKNFQKAYSSYNPTLTNGAISNGIVRNEIQDQEIKEMLKTYKDELQKKIIDETGLGDNKNLFSAQFGHYVSVTSKILKELEELKTKGSQAQKIEAEKSIWNVIETDMFQQVCELQKEEAYISILSRANIVNQGYYYRESFNEFKKRWENTRGMIR